MKKTILGFLCGFLGAFGAFAASPVVTTVVVAKDGSGDFTTIQAAVNSLRSFKPEGRSCVYIKKGFYEEKVLIHSHKSEISLVGEDRDSTVILWHDHANLPDGTGGTIGTFLTYTLRVDAPDFVCENLTVVNDAMTHNNPGWYDDYRDRAQVGQAVALHVEGDRATFRNCRFLGFQDTVYTGNPDGREYFEDCYIEGTVDFIFGPATCWFERCHIHALRRGYLTAASTPADHPYGYVFNRCRVTAREGVTGEWLGRPWRAWAYTLWLGCELDLDLDPAGWHNWGNPENEKTARYLEYGCTGRGADRSARARWSRELTPAEAARVTPQAVFGRLQTGWMPVDRPRVIVTTDGEIDDECSLVRFLLYCNEWDVEAIVTSSSQYHWRGHRWAGDDWMNPVMAAYEEVYPMLVRHDARYPSPEFLRARSFLGNVDAEGEMEQVTPGSQRIVEVLLDREDPRPVWVQAWGGTNTLARALRTIEEEHPERMAEVAARLRLYNIWEQDSSYQTYIRPHWGKYGILTIISDQFEAIAYRWHTSQPQENWPWFESAWMKKWILGAGPLGRAYRACLAGEWFSPTAVTAEPRPGAFPVTEGDFRSEGDSPSYMYVIPTGMNDPEHPDWGSWGGRYVRVRDNTWMDPVPDADWTYPEGRVSSANTWGRLTLKGEIPATPEQVAAYFRPMTRWTRAFQNDFAARMSWTVRPPAETNHQPEVLLRSAFERRVRPGETVTVAVAATDPDGDALQYAWWQYAEAGTCPSQVQVTDAGRAEARVTVPADAPSGTTIHLICEVTDSGEPALTRYARTILTVE